MFHSKKHSINAKLFETKYGYSKNLGTYKEIKKINFSNKINSLKKRDIIIIKSYLEIILNLVL